MDVPCKRWELNDCKQDKDLIRHFKEERCTGGKTKIICLGGNFRHVLNSFEKLLDGSDTKFNYTDCQRIGAEAKKIGKHIQHKICGHGGKRMVKVSLLNTCVFLG